MERTVPDRSADDLPKRPRKDYVLWISNLALVLFSAAFLLVVFSLYRESITAISLAGPSFLTTEWHLLQVLKAQTDQELFLKDQQIADLNRLYLRLINEKGSGAQLEQVRNQLRQAEAERQAILSRSISSTTDTGSAGSVSPVDQVSSVNGIALTRLLQQQIEDLQAQLDERRALIEALDSERAALISTNEQAVQRYDASIKDDMARIAGLSAEVSRRNDDIRAALAAVKQKAQDSGPAQPVGIDDLKTKALVRAVVGSPEIRAVYPDLLASLDHLFESYGLQERLKGEKDAFDSTQSVLQPLAREETPP